jgi:hypothetical protein
MGNKMTKYILAAIVIFYLIAWYDIATTRTGMQQCE